MKWIDNVATRTMKENDKFHENIGIKRTSTAKFSGEFRFSSEKIQMYVPK